MEVAAISAAPHEGEVGLVEPHDFHSSEPFRCDDGTVLPGFTLRYELYGHLNAARDNLILVCHALTGDHHAAGIHRLTDRKTGWWNHVIGPGKPLDTSRFAVLCANCLGGCSGSTGPTSLNPATGHRYGLDFPLITIGDMVRAQQRLVAHLGVYRLAAVIGGSMGGMQVLQWMVDFPDQVATAIPLASTARQNAQAIAFNEVGRTAICQDPGWENGHYAPGGGPAVGLAVARMMAHITYLSDSGLEAKFGRQRRAERDPQGGAAESTAQGADRPVNDASEPSPDPDRPLESAATSPRPASPEVLSVKPRQLFDVEFQIESYLRHQGRSFVHRFDANSYLYLTKALDLFDLTRGHASLEDAFRGVQARTLVIAYSSDWLFPPAQNKALVHALLRAGKPASYALVTMSSGHDSFLLPSRDTELLLRTFLG